MLTAVFPNFTFLPVGSFIYGLIASVIYGWIAAVIFVFFYNLWPTISAALLGQRVATPWPRRETCKMRGWTQC